MQAAVLDGAGPPEAFQIRAVPVPSLSDDGVMIALDYASVGSWDAELRSGAWGEVKKGTIVGADGSGTVAALGRNVQRFNVGDRVYSFSYGNPSGGFYAQYVCVPADRVERVPEQIDQRTAGAMPCVGLTAHSGLRLLNVERGESILVFGASGGVGSMAVWLAANVFGAEVTGTARPDAFEYVLRLGAKYAADPQLSQFKGSFDAALLTASAEHLLPRWEAHLQRGAPVAYPNGVEPEPQVEGHEVIPFDGEMTREAFQAFNDAIGTRTLPLSVDDYPFEGVAEAHRRIEKGHVIGKIALKIR
jgi:NADPH:quinone reductase